MDTFDEYLNTIEDPAKQSRIESILRHVKEKHPHLKEEIKWNQPMFVDHGTFIIAFSIAKGHISIAPEAVVMRLFEKEIEAAGYSHTQELFRIKWSDDVNFDLIDKMVAYNIEDKKDHTRFWR